MRVLCFMYDMVLSATQQWRGTTHDRNSYSAVRGCNDLNPTSRLWNHTLYGCIDPVGLGLLCDPICPTTKLQDRLRRAQSSVILHAIWAIQKWCTLRDGNSLQPQVLPVLSPTVELVPTWPSTWGILLISLDSNKVMPVELPLRPHH